MESFVITCRTLEQELTAAMVNTGKNCPVVWLDSGLHNYPQKLNLRMQEELDKLPTGDVLFAMGFCGNSFGGIRAGAHRLILPRVDDCISLLLGGMPERLQISREYAAYFLTDGWLKGEKNLWSEYLSLVETYGEEDAGELGEMLYGNYRTLGLLDTGVEPIEPFVERTRIIADTLKLEQKVIPATVTRLEKLLTGPWDEKDYIIIPPGGTFRTEDLTF